MTKKIKILFALFLFLPLSILAQYDFSADVTDGCDSLTVNFSFTSTATIDTITYLIWDFYKPGGYDTTYTATEALTTKYTIPAYYPVAVYINSTDGVPVEIKNNYIRLHYKVTADYTYKDTSEIAPNSYAFSHVDQPFDLVATYNWNFGDANTGLGRDVIHTYTNPGTYNVLLTVTNGSCIDTETQTITILSPPGVPDVIASSTFACDSLKVKFELVNASEYADSSILWNFGNGQSSNRMNPDTVTYYAGASSATGYNVIVYIGNAYIIIEKTGIVTVYKSVKADFFCADTLAGTDNIIKVCYHTDLFHNPSSVYRFTWQMEGYTENNDVRPLYTFSSEPDTVLASLTIEDLTFGCSNTRVQNIILSPEVDIPNVFTPNNDGKNDFFVINSNGSAHMNIKIYSRTGLLVYQGEGTQIVWGGKTESGMELRTGIYFYILTSSEIEDPLRKYNKTGFIYLFR